MGLYEFGVNYLGVHPFLFLETACVQGGTAGYQKKEGCNRHEEAYVFWFHLKTPFIVWFGLTLAFFDVAVCKSNGCAIKKGKKDLCVTC
jgi:hypothetical protein